MTPRWMLGALLVAVALPGCTASGERRLFAEQLELPSGYGLVNHHVWEGELGKIGGGLVDITVAEPLGTGSGEDAAVELCGELAGEAPIERSVHEVPADWDTCRFELMGQRILVGTYARFRSYRGSLADDACGPNRCGDDSLVIWIG